MSTYFLFAGHTYYPSGGFEDYEGAFETVEAAQARGDELIGGSHNWAQVVKVDGGELVLVAERYADNSVHEFTLWRTPAEIEAAYQEHIKDS